MPAVRVTMPNGDLYYPFVFRHFLDAWRKRLKEAADPHHTLLGEFWRGRFILTNGESFNFAALKLDRIKTSIYPKDW